MYIFPPGLFSFKGNITKNIPWSYTSSLKIASEKSPKPQGIVEMAEYFISNLAFTDLNNQEYNAKKSKYLTENKTSSPKQEKNPPKKL